MATIWAQATVHTFADPPGSGTVITDRGLVIPFDTKVWAAGPLLTLRVGQRVRVAVDSETAPTIVSAITLATFPTLT